MPLTRRELLGSVACGGAAALGALAFAQPDGAGPPGHVVLLGDSIFDNKPFVSPGKPVIDHLRETLPENWQATLLAAANTTAAQIAGQIRLVPPTGSHLVLCAGGNNAVLGLFNLFQRAGAGRSPLGQLRQDRADFERDYDRLVKQLLAKKLPALLCTIPEPDFAHADLQRIRDVVELGLPLFNDVVTKVAVKNRLPLLDLRVVVEGKADHAGDGIHLSPVGGRKVADRIARTVREHDFTAGQTVVFS